MLMNLMRWPGVGLLVLFSAMSASGASLRFVPEGTQLDGDAISDAATTPGALFSFFLELDTAGLSNPLVVLEYQVLRDFSELPTPPESFEFFNEAQLSFQDFAIDENQATEEAIIRLLRGDGGVADAGVAPNTVAQLQRDTYKITDRLVNDGKNDFGVVNLLRAVDSTGADVRSLFTLGGGIDVQPVPEPATACVALVAAATCVGARRRQRRLTLRCQVA
ncbi:MAG: hypothetical protein KDA61_11330 [Planctomycetales bacterium]|nr:hypothetical protein [Planctomycetales bacterium]